MQHGDDDGETLAEAELDGFQAASCRNSGARNNTWRLNKPSETLPE